MKDTVGRAGYIFLGAEDADVGFHLVVIRRDVLIAEGQSSPMPSIERSLEIHRGKAQRNASPVIGASANDARTKPAEFGSRRGGIRFAVNFPETVRRQKFVVQSCRVLASDAYAAMRQVVWPQVFLVILFRIQAADQLPALPRSARPRSAPWQLCRHLHRSNDADVVLLGRSNYLRHGAPSNPGIILNVGRALPPA